MDEDVDRDDEGAYQLEEQQAGSSRATAIAELAAATSAQYHNCSHYEPQYQQMHPSLIYYDEQAYIHHHHLHHRHSHLTDHSHSVAAAAATAASGNSLSNQQHQWEQHQDHLVHMPIMIPFGDTSSPNCFSTTGHHTEQQDQRALNETEPVVVSPDSSVVGRRAIECPEKNQKVESKTVEIVQSREVVISESFDCENSSTPTNRELHNEIERRRRSRIKHCCEVLRTLVPGLTEKTDKATVLEHTVSFVAHLVRDCQASKCNCLVNVNE